MNDEARKVFQSESAQSVLADKSTTTRCWFNTIQKYAQQNDEIRKIFRDIITEVKQQGCSKRDWSDQFVSNLGRVSALVKEHEDFIDKTRFDIWVLHFCHEHGELIYL